MSHLDAGIVDHLVRLLCVAQPFVIYNVLGVLRILCHRYWRVHQAPPPLYGTVQSSWGILRFNVPSAWYEASLEEAFYDSAKEMVMNRDIVEGNWKQLKGKVQAQWSLLVGDNRGMLAGKRTQLVGERQLAYGVIRAKMKAAMRAHSPARLMSSSRTARVI